MLLSNITGVRWCRVPCSGALFTAKSTSQFRGDVYTDDTRYSNLVIEVKNNAKAVMFNDLFNGNSLFYHWVDQLRAECAQEREGYLFFKNRGKWCWYHQLLGQMCINTHFNNLLKQRSSSKWNMGVVIQ